jgi:hypothetical protein
MTSAPAPWVAQAWQHWHRPWAVTHASWLDASRGGPGADDAPEMSLRLHYPAWCAAHALEPTLLDFADTVWWRLLGLPSASFEQVVARVGLTLKFAADPRGRLLRRATVDMEAARWALERAHFVPEPVAVEVRDAASAFDAEAYAAMSLCWCLDAAPSLWARLRLRFSREHVPSDEVADGAVDPQVQAHLGRLWRTALRISHEDRPAS